MFIKHMGSNRRINKLKNSIQNGLNYFDHIMSLQLANQYVPIKSTTSALVSTTIQNHVKNIHLRNTFCFRLFRLTLQLYQLVAHAIRLVPVLSYKIHGSEMNTNRRSIQPLQYRKSYLLYISTSLNQRMIKYLPTSIRNQRQCLESHTQYTKKN